MPQGTPSAQLRAYHPASGLAKGCDVMEIWKEVPGTNGMLEVSNHGNVRTWRLYGGISRVKTRRDVPKLVHQGLNWAGYRVASFNGHKFVHRLVLEAFVGPLPSGMQVDHINAIRDDNRLENLRYVTPQGNSDNRAAHGNHLSRKRRRIESEQVLVIRSMYAGGSTCADLAIRVGLSKSGIRKMVRGDTYPELPGAQLLRKPGGWNAGHRMRARIQNQATATDARDAGLRGREGGE